MTLLEELKAKNVDLYIHQQGIDTSTPAGRMIYQVSGVFAEFERTMIVNSARTAGVIGRRASMGIPPRSGADAAPREGGQAWRCSAGSPQRRTVSPSQSNSIRTAGSEPSTQPSWPGSMQTAAGALKS